MIELARWLETTLIRSGTSDVVVVSIDIDETVIAQMEALLSETPGNHRPIANVGIDMEHILKVCQSNGLLLAVVNTTKENDRVPATE